MAYRDLHLSGQQLLLYADGELSSRDAERVRSHLAACPGCRARAAEIEITMADFVRAQSQARKPHSDAVGPRALLKARMTELAQDSGNGRWRYLRFALDTRGLVCVCALALLTVAGIQIQHLQHAKHRDSKGVYAGVLPNPNLTPGSTRQVSFSDLCSSDGDEVVRAVPDRLERKIFEEYGMRGVPARNYEMDYLITPGLGGSDDIRNLWPEPHYNATWNSYVKDQLEAHLHSMVCGGTLSLAQAQKDIASNWIAAYKKYFHTDRPLPEPSPSNASSALAIPGGEPQHAWPIIDSATSGAASMDPPAALQPKTHSLITPA